MKCKQAEKLIINAQEIDLEERKKKLLEKHIQSCLNCSNFMKDLHSIRDKATSTMVEPSESLVETTLQRCHSELGRQNQVVSKFHFKQTKISIPKFTNEGKWGVYTTILTTQLNRMG